MRLSGKVAAITGAGRGIGRAAAELFAAEGAALAILEIDPETGSAAEQAIVRAGGEAVFIPTNVADAEDVKSSFATIEERFGALHILYNNAAIFLRQEDGPVSELSHQTWEQILSVNLSGLFYVCKYAIPLMIRSGGGSVINTSSSAGVIGIPNCDAYTATKGATISLTRSMAVEYGPQNVRVNCIAPAAIYTEMVRESNLDDPEFDEEQFLQTTPARRWGMPNDIANIALFLASGESSYLNGAIIVADGGITIT